MSEKLNYTVKEFCEAAGISVAYLYECWKRGDGPARCEFGPRVLISKFAAEEWIRSKEKRGTFTRQLKKDRKNAPNP